jgi:hypothetical protein
MPGKRVFAIRLGCLGDGTALTSRVRSHSAQDLSPSDSGLMGVGVGGRYLIQAFEEGDSHNLTA